VSELDESRRSAYVGRVCELADDVFWQDVRARVLQTHPEIEETPHELGLAPELAHALVLALAQMPWHPRREFAEAFYDLRGSNNPSRPWAQPRGEETDRRALAAKALLLTIDLAPAPLRTERIVDLVEATAQRDDLTLTPPEAFVDLAAWADPVASADLSDIEAVVGGAIVETLVPAGDAVALQEVLARVVWAAVATFEPTRVLDLLLKLDRAAEETAANY
jgi:hypothetical protein